MAEHTTYYNFEKPEGSDLISPTPFNNNWDSLDEQLHYLSLATGGAQPWHEIVDFEETNFSLSAASSVNYYRNFTDQSNNISYYDKLFLMIYFKATFTNSDTSDSKYWYMYPAFYTNGTLAAKTRLYGLALNKNTTGVIDRVWRNESSMFMSNNRDYGSLSDQVNFFFPQHRRTIDGVEWSDQEYNYVIMYKPFSVSTSANQFGVQITTQSNLTGNVETLKVRLYGQRTWGDMRF